MLVDRRRQIRARRHRLEGALQPLRIDFQPLRIATRLGGFDRRLDAQLVLRLRRDFHDIAGTQPWRKLRRALQPDGKLVIVGSQKSANPLIGPLGHIFRTKALARSRAAFFVAKFNRPDMEVLRELLASGKVKPVIERVYPFAEIADALAYMGEGHARAKLVVAL